MSDSSESDFSNSEWEAVEEPLEDVLTETTCLFCFEKFASPEVVFEHCHSQHGFDIAFYVHKNSLDAISYIKLVNYTRLKGCTVAELFDMPVNNAAWNKDDYMKPTVQNDPLLMFDIEGYLEEKFRNDDKGDVVSLPRNQFEELLQKLAAKELQLQNAAADMEKMKMAAHNVFLAPDMQSSDDEELRIDSDRDESYFSTYDHFGIHHEMLQDCVRTEAYRSVILDNRKVFEGKMVLDVGCGTAILSMFAASAGAKMVLGVDQSYIIYQAMDIIRENGFDKIIHLYKDKLEHCELPVEKVDIIVSEWMGYFLLYEGMLDTVIYARDKFLAPGGVILPNRCSISLVALSDLEFQKRYLDFWDDVYGFKMSCMKTEALKEASIELVDGDKICSHPVVVKELNLMTCTVEQCDFATDFVMEFTKKCQVTTLVGYFDCFFDMGVSNKVQFTTSPTSKPTHWKQTIFPLSHPIFVAEGQKIEGKISCQRRAYRSLFVTLKLDTRCQQYSIH